ncbi:MAG TPA: hypothetical protein V6C52_01045 [Coleofasciculaceae cyanobacterium]|jgi:hypothetical protein
MKIQFGQLVQFSPPASVNGSTLAGGLLKFSKPGWKRPLEVMASYHQKETDRFVFKTYPSGDGHIGPNIISLSRDSGEFIPDQSEFAPQLLNKEDRDELIADAQQAKRLYDTGQSLPGL